MYKNFFKRVIDIVASTIGIIVLIPIWLILFVAIFIDDPGPIFFTQKRVGKKKKGKLSYFKVLKFRTMKKSTPHDVPTHLLKNPEQYITRMGRFLRKTSLDEIPQIFCIFIGTMSIIGPRPALWNQDDLVAEREKYGANDVKPGLTGLAQIRGRDELEIEEKARIDGEYAQNLSLKMDLKCFFGTIKAVLLGEGIVEGGTGKIKEKEKSAKGLAISFSPPDISELEVKEVCEVLRSGWITTGPKTKEFERKLAEYFGTKKTVCLNSQTACAELTLRLLGVGEGDEVITTAYTYTASASVVRHVNAKLVLIDTQENSFEMDYDALEKAITKKTKVIIPVDLGGVPCDYDRIYQIVERKKNLFSAKTDIQALFGRVIVMADTAHALGAKWKGKMVGSVADFSCFSFHAVKNLTTAEGGAVTWKSIEGITDEEIYKKYQLLSLHGQSKDALEKSKIGAWEYDIIGTWYKCNMTDVAAAMGLMQFERYQGMLDRRRELIKRYDKALKEIGVEVLEHYTDDYQSSGHLYLTRINGISVEKRNEIIVKMEEQGIACNVHYKPLPMHTAYKELGFDIKDYPNAYAHYVNEITLPLHTCLTDEQVEYLLDKYVAIVKEIALC